MTTIYAIKIDPAARCVSRIAVDGDDYRALRAAIGCDMLEAISYINRENDCLMGDEEALFKESKQFFAFMGYPAPIAGACLVVGTDEEGDTITPAETVEGIARRVMWLDLPTAVQAFNHNVASMQAEAAIENAKGGQFVVVCSPLLDEEGNAV